jgi:hypothetical protein
MVSLTTVYILSTILASMGAMGAAYFSNKPVVTKPEVVVEKKKDLKELIIENFVDPQIKPEIAELMAEFLEKPVDQFNPSDRSKISSNLKKIYLATHPDRKQCPGKLGELCGIIFNKARSIDAFTKDGTLEGSFTGNLTDQALQILNNPE